MAHPSDISISDFTYDLPEDKIAAYPNEKRDEAKLLIYKNGQIDQSIFNKLGSFLPRKSLLVFNNTRVISARLNFVSKENKPIELFCLGPVNSLVSPAQAMVAKRQIEWRCLVGNLKRWKEEELILDINNLQLRASILSKNAGDVDIKFSWSPPEFTFMQVVETLGNIPIPPYLNRKSEEIDTQRYQTVYASTEGSVAAPTAGLHFTNELLTELADLEIDTLALTLHVGAGTFKPVKSPTLAGHTMHSEWIDLDYDAIKKLRNNLANTIVAVGTTSLRAMESLYWMGLKAYYNPAISLSELEIKQWDAYDLGLKEIDSVQSLNALLDWMANNNLQKLTCCTQILIAPPYSIKLAKGLITNFHQPQSTLLLLVAAFAGSGWKDIYTYALNHDFRFLSYGDSSLLLR